MKLHEYQAKEIMRRYGIPTPRGEVARTAAEAADIALRIGVPVAVKAQVHVGGRGKAGGIAIAPSADEARLAAGRILGMSIKGLAVRSVLVEHAVRAEREYYVGVTIDRARRAPVVIASSEGGVDIEDVAARAPDRIVRAWASPLDGFDPWEGKSLALAAGFDRGAIAGAGACMSALFRLFVQEDASLAEINPLMLTADGRVVAADAKIVLDDNALARHPEHERASEVEVEDGLEREARRRRLAYVRLDGDIGVMGNGAGLVMATLDAVEAAGGRGANFLDIGGGARADVVRSALEVLLMDERVRVVLVNVFGGITRCDEVASGLLAAAASARMRVPMVVRLVGTNEEEGKAMLRDAAVVAADTMEDAARLAVELARARRGN